MGQPVGGGWRARGGAGLAVRGGDGFGGVHGESIPRVGVARSATARGCGLCAPSELTGSKRDDQRTDDGLKAGGATEAAELFMFLVLFAAGWTDEVSYLLLFWLSSD
jgi:hypothetical protein